MWERKWARLMVPKAAALNARLKLGFHPEGGRDQLVVLSELGCGQVCVTQCGPRLNLEVAWSWGACKQGSPCNYQGSTDEGSGKMVAFLWACWGRVLLGLSLGLPGNPQSPGVWRRELCSGAGSCVLSGAGAGVHSPDSGCQKC